MQRPDSSPAPDALNAAVSGVHARLLVRYGAAWVHAYPADVGQDAIAADWRDQMRGLTPAQVRWALEHLPEDRPPNAGQFRALARQMPRPAEPAKLPPPAVPEGRRRIAEAMREGIRLAQQARGGMSEREWALHRLEQRVAAGGATVAQREALRVMREQAGPAVTVQALGEFRPVPPEVLPPAMRAELEGRS